LLDFFTPRTQRGHTRPSWRGRFTKLEYLILNQDFPTSTRRIPLIFVLDFFCPRTPLRLDVVVADAAAHRHAPLGGYPDAPERTLSYQRAPLSLNNRFGFTPLIERIGDEFSPKRDSKKVAGGGQLQGQANGKALRALQA
jgi:hypothetical protein